MAGALLAWRLARRCDVERVGIAVGGGRDRDATAASGGACRGFETEAGQRKLAIDSLVELLSDERLRDWAGYTETGSVYRPVHTGAIEAGAAEIAAAVPNSVSLLTAADLRERGWAGDSEGRDDDAVVAVAERRAGYLDPERLRTRVLADLADRAAVELLPDGDVTDLAPGSFRLGGKSYRADVVVLATGAWTPALLRAAGFADDRLRTKAIQYTVFGTDSWRPGTFVDEVSGLYGKPAGDRQLMGLPTDVWDADPDQPGGLQPDQALSDAVVRHAQGRFPQLRLVADARPVVALDCYSADFRLALRPVPGTGGRLYTFTGGSGGAAKTVLAASAQAAAQLAAGAEPNHHHLRSTEIGDSE